MTEERKTQQLPMEEENPPTQAEDIASESIVAEEASPENEPSTETDPEPDYAQMASEDLAQIKRLGPAYASVSHLGELPFARRFAQLRDLGLSVREALAASAPRFDKVDSRAHLRAVAPHGKSAPAGLDRAQMKDARLLFGNLSDAQINALYRRVTQKNND